MMVIVLLFLLILIFFLIRIIIKKDYKITQNEDVSQRNLQLFHLMYKWYLNEKKGIKIEKYIVENEIESIAIYGKGQLGELFFSEIENIDRIKSICWIDKSLRKNLNGNVPIYNTADYQEYKDMEVIVITPIKFYDEIEKELRGYGIQSEILSLEDIVYSI